MSCCNWESVGILRVGKKKKRKKQCASCRDSGDADRVANAGNCNGGWKREECKFFKRLEASIEDDGAGQKAPEL